MFPWTHAAFGYALLLVLAVALSRRVSRAELLAVVVGTQLPDLVDKPLAWWFNVLPSGRSLAHSLVVAVPLLVLVLAVAWYRSHPAVGAAFALGYASHLLGDTYVELLYWRTEDLSFLLYPFLPAYPYDDGIGFGEFLSAIEVTTPLLLGLAVAVVAGLGFLVHFLRAPWLPE